MYFVQMILIKLGVKGFKLSLVLKYHVTVHFKITSSAKLSQFRDYLSCTRAFLLKFHRIIFCTL